ncbi:unnamed protein product [Schistosoma mattheei]|uniref:Uncharacterized protein n=1 Tax=Schistosoma mattheei TaxID=31246 RepID=A0A183NZZ3_9TREM|nr:unnamed protein product [Schistosoma mattheei]
MVVGGQQETPDSGFVLFGTCQQGVPVILRELVLLDGFDPDDFGGLVPCSDLTTFTIHILYIVNISSSFNRLAWM